MEVIIIPAHIIPLRSSNKNTCPRSLVERGIWLAAVSTQVLLHLRILILSGKDCPFLLD